MIDILGDFSPRQLSVVPGSVARTVAGLDLTTVLGIVLAFILLDIVGTALLVIFSAGAGKRSSSQTGFFNWDAPLIQGLRLSYY